jgi:hypothetical protein
LQTSDGSRRFDCMPDRAAYWLDDRDRGLSGSAATRCRKHRAATSTEYCRLCRSGLRLMSGGWHWRCRGIRAWSRMVKKLKRPRIR